MAKHRKWEMKRAELFNKTKPQASPKESPQYEGELEAEIIKRFFGDLGEVWLCKQGGLYYTRSAQPFDHCGDKSHELKHSGLDAGYWYCETCEFSFDDECFHIIEMPATDEEIAECGFCGSCMLKTDGRYGLLYWCPCCGAELSAN